MRVLGSWVVTLMIKPTLIAFVFCFLGMMLYFFFENGQMTKDSLNGSLIIASLFVVLFQIKWLMSNLDAPFIKWGGKYYKPMGNSDLENVQPLSSQVLQNKLKEFGLLDKFSRSVRNQDFWSMKRLIKKCGVPNKEAAKTAFAILDNPGQYGYQ